MFYKLDLKNLLASKSFPHQNNTGDKYKVKVNEDLN